MTTKPSQPSEMNVSNGHRFFDVIKRILDFVTSAISLMLLFPLFLIAYLSIKLESPGPVLYRQVRIGKDGKPFPFFKFRTMNINFDSDKHREYLDHLAKSQESRQSGTFSIREDIRITNVGRFLRRFSIDELPSILSVLMGYMSIVGPRPLTPRDAEHIAGLSPNRLSVKPGLTGLWQVSSRTTTFEEMLRLDSYYVENRSFALDIKILLMTIPVALLGRPFDSERTHHK